MKILLLTQCLNCRKITGFVWLDEFDERLVDIVIDKCGNFNIAISHGYCPECFIKLKNKLFKGGDIDEA